MISQEQADKIVAANNLRDAVKLLGGTMTQTENKIVITYNETNQKSQTKEV